MSSMTPELSAAASAWLETALSGDVASLLAAAEAAHACMDAPSIFDELVAPAAQALAVMHARKAIEPAQVAVAGAALDAVASELESRVGPCEGPFAVVAAAPGDEHRLGPRAAACAAAAGGCTPVRLLPGASTESMAECCRRLGAALWIISVSTDEALPRACAEASASRATIGQDVIVLLGGGAVARAGAEWKPPEGIESGVLAADCLKAARRARLRVQLAR